RPADRAGLLLLGGGGGAGPQGLGDDHPRGPPLRLRRRDPGRCPADGGHPGVAPMSLKRGCLVLLLLAAPAQAEPLVKKLAAQATEGAMEKVQPVIAATLADVDRRLVTHEDRIGNIAGNLLDQAG